MKNARWIWPFLLSVAMLPTFASSSAFACGGVDGVPSKVPCSCGDTVDISPTILNAKDPVTTSVCTPASGLAALFVNPDVNLKVSSARIRCDNRSAPMVGILLLGDGVTIDGGSGTIEGCDVGIYVPTSHNTIERVAVRNGFSVGILAVGVFVEGGDDNTLRHILCDNFLFGILVLGDGNLLERNYCQKNVDTGIMAVGANTLNHNQGRNNGGQGVFAASFSVGGPVQTDRRNYGIGNAVTPDCEIDGHTGTSGRYC
jgi:hypothetical protein